MLSRSALLLGCAAAAMAAGNTQSWLYPEVLGRGPSNWWKENQICADGEEQSPVDITQPMVDRYLKPLNFSYVPANGFQLVNNQHAVKVVPNNNVGYVLDTNNGNERYDLVQIHFHAPSEHGIAGGLTDLEMHMVHELRDQANVGEKYRYLVVGVLFNAAANTPNENFGFFDQLPIVPRTGLQSFAHYNNADHTANDNTASSTGSFDFEGILSSRKYYTYSGSFTTPPCTEGVKWYVMSDVGSVSVAQLNAFRNAMRFSTEMDVATANGWDKPAYAAFGNNRPVQPLYNRTVSAFTDNFPKYGMEDDDETAAFTLSFVGLVLAIMTIAVAGWIFVAKP